MEKASKKDTVFLIGSGNSLNKIDMAKLADCDTISMNRQYIAYDDWGFNPTYYVIIDSKLIKTTHQDIEKLIKEKSDIEKFFIMKHGDNGMSPWVDNMKKAVGPDKVISILAGGSEKFLSNLDFNLSNKKISYCGNAGACSVEIARFLGYKRVVLLGIDAKYENRQESIKQKKDLSHFRPDYFDVETFKEGVNQGVDNHNSGTKYWKLMAGQQKGMPDFEIISSSPGSPINEFLEYVEFDELFKNE